MNRNFVADAADIVSPAVVNILCAVDSPISPGAASSGSGFIISKDGFIVTNAHVVERASLSKVLITMWNSKKRYGIVHSMDRQSDIALIKLIDIDVNEDIPVVKLGINNRPRVGEFVIALGSPLHLTNSVTFGIISSTARHASELGMLMMIITIPITTTTCYLLLLSSLSLLPLLLLLLLPSITITTITRYDKKS